MAKSEKKVRIVKAVTYSKRVRKAERGVLEFNSKQIEDDFIGLSGIENIVTPPFEPKWLKLLITHNNTLNQCVAAMEINIDGSGWVIEAETEGMEAEVEEGEEESEEAKKEREEKEKKRLAQVAKATTRLEEFFAEVSPGVSFLKMRRMLRRDMESCGNGFLEVIRNAKEEVTALKAVDASTMRLVKLDGSIVADKILIRGGQEISVKMRVRERRFLQVIASEKIYFKEFGASRHLHAKTGRWEVTDSAQQTDTPIPFEDRATEMIHFLIDKDSQSPYGVPRWINNLPSILGSRKAEEGNLNFFDAGGVPPVILTLMGGRFVADVDQQIKNFLNSKNVDHRIMVLQAESAEGTFESGAANFKMDVQRFGSEKMKDSLFEKYDERCGERVRSSFRIPPLFLGQVKEFNFATAFTAYLIAESQVFQPERKEFDDIINNLIIPELGVEGVRLRSSPMGLKDQKLQLEGLKLAVEKSSVLPEDVLKTINEIVDLKMKFDDTPPEEPDFPEGDDDEETPFGGDKPEGDEGAEDVPEGQSPGGQQQGGGQQKPGNPAEKRLTVRKRGMEELMLISDDLIAVAIGEEKFSAEFKAGVYRRYNSLHGPDRSFVVSVVTTKVFDSVTIDREGAHDIIEACLGIEEGEQNDG